MHALFRRLAEDRDEIELVRDYDKPVDKVWAALTTPARIEAWMGVEWLSDRDAPLTLGGPFNYRFTDTDMQTEGRVLRFEPPHLLEHSWFETLSPSYVTWRLEETASGCRLTLTHRLPSTEEGPRTAAGWTMLLDALAAWLVGEPFQPEQSWRAVRDEYADRFGPESVRDGRKVEIDGAPALRFDRILRRPIDAVFAALTTPAGIKGWLQATAEVEPRPGGRIRLVFHSGGDHRMTGEILAYEPPSLFVFTWPEAQAGADSTVRIELEALGETACRLVLIHRLPKGEGLEDFASGWHWHLDGLIAAADGVDTPWDGARWGVLKKMYQATLSTP